MATSQITVSIDGMRLSMASNLKEVQSRLEELFDEIKGIDAYKDYVDSIKEAMDDLNGSVGSFFFVYIDGMEDFSNLTDEHDKYMPARFDEEN